MTFNPAIFPLTTAPDRRVKPAGVRRFAAMLTLAFSITSIGLLAAPTSADAWSSGQYNSTSEHQLVALTNQSRAAAGLRALRVDSTLTAIARSRSRDMIVRNYFSHSIPPSGKNVFSILDSKRYCYAIAGENIGWNNYPDDVATKTIHKQFMASPSHRSNILGKRWDVIGIGAYKGPTGKKMWTVLFADKCGSSGGTAPKPKPKTTSSRPAAKPTPAPTPVPTPVRTMPPEPTDPIGLGFGPGDRNNNTRTGPDGGAALGGGTAGSGTAASLRVIDPAIPPGLVQTIVGDVTGSFFGG
jgi:uncharacterized protein YkwD